MMIVLVLSVLAFAWTPAMAEAPGKGPAQEEQAAPDTEINHIRIQTSGPSLQGVGAGTGSAGVETPSMSSTTKKEVDQAIGAAVENAIAKKQKDPPTCRNCHGVFVRGRYDPNNIGKFACNGAVCRTCTGVTPATPCPAFCLTTKENLWAPPDPKTFTREEMTPYKALFDRFGFQIPESCICSRSMFTYASSYGMGYSPGSCRECVPVGNDTFEFSACLTADWCAQHCK